MRLVPLLAAALLLTVLAPSAAAGPDPVAEAVECVTAPSIPETSLYQRVWRCTLGDVHPEPVEHFTGCKPSSPPDLSCLWIV